MTKMTGACKTPDAPEPRFNQEHSISIYSPLPPITQSKNESIAFLLLIVLTKPL